MSTKRIYMPRFDIIGR